MVANISLSGISDVESTPLLLTLTFEATLKVTHLVKLVGYKEYVGLCQNLHPKTQDWLSREGTDTRKQETKNCLLGITPNGPYYSGKTLCENETNSFVKAMCQIFGGTTVDGAMYALEAND